MTNENSNENVENSTINVEETTIENTKSVESTAEETELENINLSDDTVNDIEKEEKNDDTQLSEVVNNDSQEKVSENKEIENETNEDEIKENITENETNEDEIKENITENETNEDEIKENIAENETNEVEIKENIAENETNEVEIKENITESETIENKMEEEKEIMELNNEPISENDNQKEIEVQNKNTDEEENESTEDESTAHYLNLSKEELIEIIQKNKEKYKLLKKKTDNKIKETNNYIERLEEATEQRIQRMKKKNEEEINEMKEISDEVIRSEKKKAQQYIDNIKKGVDDEREVLRQIEIDSRSRFQKEKEEKIEAHEEINRLNHVITDLNGTIEKKNIEISNLEEKNMGIFIQKEKEIDEILKQVDMEKQNCLNANKQIEDLNMTIESLNDKINELNDELYEFKNESKIRKSQLNLLNVENEQMQKKVKSLTQKNEELNNLYELQMIESSGLKTQIEKLNNQVEHMKRKKMPRLSNFASPLTPYSANSIFSANSSFVISDDKQFSIPTSSSDSQNKGESKSVVESGSETTSKPSSLIDEPLSDGISITSSHRTIGVIQEEDEESKNDTENKNDSGIIKIGGEEEKVNCNVVIEKGESEEETLNEIDLNSNDEKANSEENSLKKLRTLSINTDIIINEPKEDEINDDVFDYEPQNLTTDVIKKPLVYHTNNQIYVNFCEILKEDYTKIYNTKLVKQCELEEVVQCLDFNGSYIGFFNKRKLLNGLKNNTLVIQAKNEKLNEENGTEIECVLCCTKHNTENIDNEMIWYQFYYDDEKNSISEWICMFCRERLVTTCNWFKYLSMINKKIIKQDIDTIYSNCLHLKECMYHARNGLISEEDSSIMNLSMAITDDNIMDMNDFEEINIDEEIKVIKNLDNDNASNASTTIQNTSELSDYQIVTPTISPQKENNNPNPPTTRKRSSCYVNEISKKMSITTATA